MKNYILILLMFVSLVNCSNDSETFPIQGNCNYINFKYYNDAQYSLGEMSNEYLIIGINETYENDEIENFISSINIVDQNYDYSIFESIGMYDFKVVPIKFNSPKNCREITQIISELNQNGIVSYSHFTMQTDDCNNQIGISMGDLCVNTYLSSFYVKVFDENDLSDLNHMIEETNTELVRQNQFMEKWFELRATKDSEGDALAMANLFYESGHFEYSEPSIMKYAVE